MTAGDSIPAGWATTTVGDVTDSFTTVDPKKEPDRDFTYVDIGSIDNATQRIVAPKAFKGAAAPSRARRLLREGDVLFSTVRPYLKNVAAVPAQLDGCLTSTGISVLRATDALHPRFLFWRVISDDFVAAVGRSMDGALYPAVRDADVLGAEICLPPVPEQCRIVDKIEALTARSSRAKDALDAIPPLLERFRQSVLAAAFRGDLTADWRAQNPGVEPADQLLARIRKERRSHWEEAELAKMRAKGKEPANDKWKAKYKEPEPVVALSKLPKGWCWITVGTGAPLQPGYAFPSKSFSPTGVRLLKGINVRDGWISTEELDYWDERDADTYSSFQLASEDVVLAMDRPVYSSGSRGTKIAQLDGSWEGALLLQRVGRFQSVPSLHRRYLYWYGTTHTFRDHLIGRQTGTQDGKDLPHVSARVVDSAPIPVPPLAEQIVIASLLDRALIGSSRVAERLGEAEEYRRRLDQAILAKAFRGELVPQDPADEPASVLLERIREQLEKATPKKKSKRSRSKQAST